MEAYYRRRAAEYEAVYEVVDSGRRRELDKIGPALQASLRGRSVLEVAFGTGYWTEVLSHVAKKITAVDIADEMLEIARMKPYDCPVSLKKGDAYSLPPGRRFTGGMANFWLSHVPRERLSEFLIGFQGHLRKGAMVFMADNVYIPGVGGELVMKEGDANSYKLRELKDGTKHLVLKNYFSKNELTRVLESGQVRAKVEEIFFGKSYWFVSYSV